MKECRRCHITKPLSEFSRTKKGPVSQCKTCMAERERLRYQASEDVRAKAKAAARRHSLQKKYGMTQADYERMLAEQNGGCALCGNPPGLDKREFLSVDHDHQTGRVRGLLCTSCNRGLGLLRDDPNILERATAYLRRG